MTDKSALTIRALRASGFDYGKVPLRSLGVGTHLEALAWAAGESAEGDVLEMGSGVFSTPWLHGYCEARERTLWTNETDPLWLDLNRELYGSPGHVFTDDPLPPEGEYSLVFIDGGPGGGMTWQARRELWLRHFAGTDAMVVVHDIDGRSPNVIAALDLFPRRRDFARVQPATAVVWS